MKRLVALERTPGERPRELEVHDVTHRRPSEVERMRAVLELAYPDPARHEVREEEAVA